MLLSFSTVGDGPDLGIVLHGILGAGRNWRAFARRLVAVRPGLRLLLVDLRNHGDSPDLPPPHTVAACADDVAALVAHQGVRPGLVVGHSFGGKVALALAQRLPPGPREVWVLDAAPGATPGARVGVSQVIAALRGVPQPLARRGDLVGILGPRGVPRHIAQWLGTSLRETDLGYAWRFDLDTIETMVSEFLATDLWPLVEAPPQGAELHFVRAERSARWDPAVLARFAAAPPVVRLHLLGDAGHWLHVDNPEGLLALMSGAR